MLAKNILMRTRGFDTAIFRVKQNIFVCIAMSILRYFLTLQGDIAHIINGRCEQLRRGSLVLIRPDDIHDYKYQSGDLYRFINLAFDRETAQSLFIF